MSLRCTAAALAGSEWIKQVRCGMLIVAAGAVAVAALFKLSDLPAFAAHVRTWRLVPGGYVGLVVGVVPAAELLLGGAVVMGLSKRWAPLAILAMLWIFTAGLAVMALRTPDAACGCLGWLTRNAPFWDTPRGGVARNLLLIALLTLSLRKR